MMASIWSEQLLLGSQMVQAIQTSCVLPAWLFIRLTCDLSALPARHHNRPLIAVPAQHDNRPVLHQVISLPWSCGAVPSAKPSTCTSHLRHTCHQQ